MTTKKAKQRIKAIEAEIQKLKERHYDLRRERIELQHNIGLNKLLKKK